MGLLTIKKINKYINKRKTNVQNLDNTTAHNTSLIRLDLTHTHTRVMVRQGSHNK